MQKIDELVLFEEHEYKRLLRYYGLSQQEIAKIFGISQSNLSNKLNGKSVFTFEQEEFLEDLILELRAKRRIPMENPWDRVGQITYTRVDE